MLAEVPMLKYLFVASCLSLFVSSVAMAQHGGTQQERRACGGNVHRYCRPMLDQGDFAVLACLQQHRDKPNASCKKVLTNHGQ
jgi:hypothetical protein